MARVHLQAAPDLVEQLAHEHEPLKAVFELIWNSLDADAHHVQVHIKTGPPWCRGSPRSSRATTSNTPSASRCTTSATPTMNGGTVVPTSAGRAQATMTDWTALNYVVVDVEGNGQQPPDLVELAAVPIVAGVIGEPVSWLVKPALPIRNFATRIHGLTDKAVADAPAFEKIAADVLKALDADALIAHNAHVDIGVLQRHLGDWECPEVFDTLKLARRLLLGRESYKLGTLVEAFKLDEGLDESLTPHRATYDALVTARLILRLANIRDDRPLTLEELRGDPPGGGDDEPATLF